MQVVDQQLAVDPRADDGAPGEVEAHHDVVAQGGERVGVVLGLEPLHQDVGNDAGQVERLPARAVIARGLGQADAQAARRLPLEPVRRELLAGCLVEGPRERRGVGAQRLEPCAQRQRGEGGRGLRERERGLLARAPVPAAAAQARPPAALVPGVGDVRVFRMENDITARHQWIGERARAVHLPEQQVRVDQPVVEGRGDPCLRSRA